MKIAIGCDHGGYLLKQDILIWLEELLQHRKRGLSRVCRKGGPCRGQWRM